MKLGILLIILGCFGVIVAIMNHHLILCGGGIIILICAGLRISARRSRAKTTPEEPKE